MDTLSKVRITTMYWRRTVKWLWDNGVALSSYLVATFFTSAHFTADTADYVESIVAYQRGQYYQFWEVGHILWRPLGWLLLRILEPFLLSSTGDLKRAATLVLVTMSWLAGLATVLTLCAIFRRTSAKTYVVNLTVVAFIFSHGFLNYAQSGPPYITALLAMALALYVLLRKGKGHTLSATDSIIAGVVIALMICFWLPFIVVVPAILVARLVLMPPTAREVMVSTGTGAIAGVLVAFVYLAVVIGPLGFRTTSEFLEWQRETSGRTSQDKGLARTAIGFPRSFIYMGNDGMILKRYVVRDPFNPVGPFDLLKLSLWKIALFYLFFASLVANLLYSPTGRRVLILLLIATASVVGFAIYWHGGDIERYLPLFPILFLAVAFILNDPNSRWIPNCVAVAFLVAAGGTNLYGMSLQKQNQREARTAARIADLRPRLKPFSRVFVVSLQDELYSFPRDFPFNPINAGESLKVNPLVELSGKDVPLWRKGFASTATAAWRQGGDVWITRRVFAARPQSEWNWVEGDDVRVSWVDFVDFFSQLDFGDLAGGDDGFVRVLDSEKTHLVLDQASSR